MPNVNGKYFKIRFINKHVFFSKAIFISIIVQTQILGYKLLMVITVVLWTLLWSYNCRVTLGCQALGDLWVPHSYKFCLVRTTTLYQSGQEVVQLVATTILWFPLVLQNLSKYSWHSVKALLFCFHDLDWQKMFLRKTS